MQTNDPWGPLPDFDLLAAQQAAKIATRELARRELARQDFLGFVDLFTPNYIPGWVHQEIAQLLDAFIEACERSLSPRLMIFLPPRAGKSQMVSRCFPPYILGKHPEWEVITATYGQDLASNFGRDARQILNDPIYLDLFPLVHISKDSNAVDHVRTTAKGSYTAVGVGGPLTGLGAKILLIDDPVKDREAADSELQRESTWNWYSSVARTRLAPGGGIIVLQTRWHEEDLAGKLLQHAKDNPDADQWHVYSFPAIATEDEPHRKKGEALHPQRYNEKELAKIRASLQPRDWSALYQQNPTPDDGNYFKRAHIHPFPKDGPPKNLYWYIATDFAIGEKETNDWTVLTPFAVDDQSNIYFHDPIRARMDAFEIVESLLDLAHKHKVFQIAIETGHISKTLGPQLNKRMAERREYFSLWPYTPSRDKVARARSLQARMQQKKVFFEHSRQFHDLHFSELLAFPAGRWDDYVDTCALACLMLDELISPAPPPALPDESANLVEGSFDWMMNQSPASREAGRHAPKKLFGSPPSRSKGFKW